MKLFSKNRVLFLLVLTLSLPFLQAQELEPKIHWVTGPTNASLKNTAQIKIPENFRFAGSTDAQKLLQASGNPTSGAEMGLIAPDKERWFVVFEFADTGYIKDDDKNKLDPDKMLQAIVKGTEAGNEQRRKMGAPLLKVVGWEQKPHYDEQTHNLEWAIRAESEGTPIVNYNTRLLGRKGVMEVALVVKPDELQETLPKFKSLLADYQFKEGETYAEYRPGDKIAKYGLAALITGGAAVVAVKTGLLSAVLLLFKKAWKLLILAFVAVGSFFKRIFSRRDSPNPPHNPSNG